MDIINKEHIINIIKSMKNIVGILSTSQPVKFGKTKNGKPIYQIKPIKKILPPFWITYGGKLQGRIIISFKFKEWNDDSKSPFGEIIKVIGLVDESNLSETLLSHYEIDRKSFVKNELKLNDFESIIIRKDLKHLNIFSIDPKGCIDIDDALSYQEIEDKIYIGVHIAQPICWLKKQEIIDRYQIAFSTLYLNEEKNKNLWSDELTEKASLFVNQQKPAYTIMFTIQNNKVINIESFPSIIINKLNTCYEKINFPDIQKIVVAKISVVGNVIDPLSRSFYIEAKLPIDKNFRPNQLVQVKIKDYEKKNAISAPINLLQNDEKGKFIYVAVMENGKLLARKKAVTVGEYYGNNVEILAGLVVGDNLITEGYQTLFDGQNITTSDK
jgi:hypothetical protein